MNRARDSRDSTQMTSLRDQLLSFIDRLRGAGVRISVGESIDAMNAAAAAGLERARLREALAASLIKDEADRTAFDESFERFFAMPARESGAQPEHRGQQLSAASGRGRPGENPQPREDAPPRQIAQPSSAAASGASERAKANANQQSADEREVTPQGTEESEQAEASGHDDSKAARDSSDAAAEGARGIAGARIAKMRAIERLPFEEFSDFDYDSVRDALAPLIRRFKIRVGRRLRLSRTGRIDFRRTIRAGMQRGGALIDLKFRARRPRHIDLVILADLSGSVRYAAQLMLQLVGGARECFRRVTSFVFVDHLAEADFEQGHLVMTPALDLYARSDFGRVLGELWERRAGLLTRTTVVVIMGDGRNNRFPPRADLLREIARICRGVVWLSPEDPARWGTGDSAIKQYAREIGTIIPSRNLHELQSALLKVA